MKKYTGDRIKKDFQRNWSLYLLVIPVIIFYAIFMYKPMYGAIIAFMDYTPAKGVSGSDWVGFANFTRFFSSPYFVRLLRNTILLSVYSIVFGFPAPIILALLLNEVGNKKFKKISQTVTYLPHFVSMVVICGMIKDFCLSTGLINDIIAFFGGGARTAFAGSEIFQNDLYRLQYLAGGRLGLDHIPLRTLRRGQPAL